LKKLLFIAAIILSMATGVVAQKGFKTTTTGLKYKFLFQGKGKKPQLNDVITLGIIARNSKDSIIDNTYDKARPLRFPLKGAAFKGALEEGFLLMGEGDSAVFLVKSDSLYDAKKGNPRPSFVAAGSMVQFTVKLDKVQSFEAFKKERHEHYLSQKEKDDKAITAYLNAKGLKSTKTASGLHCVTLTEGAGITPLKGNNVVIHYTAKLLDREKKFDSSYDKKIPFDFSLGWGLVIKGVDEGIANMKEGEKRLLLIPSYLAYGEKGQKDIVPADAPVLYEVELLKVTNDK